jgi:hypothetical protein
LVIPNKNLTFANEINKQLRVMGMFFNNDKKHYCGRYKGIDVWQYGSMIGNNWYGEFYITIPKGKTKRNMKVKDSVCRSLDAVKDYINKHLEELKNKSNG